MCERRRPSCVVRRVSFRSVGIPPVVLLPFVPSFLPRPVEDERKPPVPSPTSSVPPTVPFLRPRRDLDRPFPILFPFAHPLGFSVGFEPGTSPRFEPTPSTHAASRRPDRPPRTASHADSTVREVRDRIGRSFPSPKLLFFFFSFFPVVGDGTRSATCKRRQACARAI